MALNWALISTSFIPHQAIARIVKHNGSQLYSIHGRNPDLLKQFESQYGFQHYPWTWLTCFLIQTLTLFILFFLGTGPINLTEPATPARPHRPRTKVGFMGNLYWLKEAQMEQISPYSPKSHDVLRVDDQLVLGGLIYINPNGLRRRDEP